MYVVLYTVVTSQYAVCQSYRRVMKRKEMASSYLAISVKYYSFQHMFHYDLTIQFLSSVFFTLYLLGSTHM